MDNAGSILTLALAALVLAFFGYQVKKERERLRETVGLLDDNDMPLIASVERLVFEGKLSPDSITST